ncbi:FHIP family protein GH13096 [Coccinella septempunctata]|uniref:FHIP family protein GH13096 n=1 Tax=Coccinella septempunctata TaxID=41139 RepID=UPI001D07DB48|nr:FHIP family protein GH13096 [Coccinella septempunctata]
MEWLRNHTVLNKQPRALLYEGEDYDPQACYDSFKEHWQQALKIIQRVQQLPKHDDVLGVMNHLEQMVTLLLYDIKKMNKLQTPICDSSMYLDYLLTENILDKLNNWGSKAGKYSNAVRCEQFKIYEMLLSHSRHVLLVHEPFLKPLLRLLKSCQSEMFSKEMEKFLVDLLYQLCTLLMQNNELVDLFFFNEQGSGRFIIFILLITFIHRDDSTGMRARDALLLCMSISKKNNAVATFITETSNISVLIASGLSGLYSVLPNYLDDIAIPDWYRFTPDDVNDIKGLSTFITSLEFSNAVAQIAHISIRKQLQEFIYRGFLIPVLGPALLQNNVEEQVASIAYTELILRTVTQPGLLYSMLEFLLKTEYDGRRLVSILLERLNTNNHQLSLVTISLFETMLDMNSEDLMLELVFQYLHPCLHIMFSHRINLLILDPYCYSFEKLLVLAPSCCDVETNSPSSRETSIQNNNQRSLCGRYDSYLYDARNKIANCQQSCASWSNSYDGHHIFLEKLEATDDKNSNLNMPLHSVEYEEESKTTTEPSWKLSSNQNSNSLELKPIPIKNGSNAYQAGPFLTFLLQKLSNYLSNSFYVNLHLTGLISRLAIFPHALLRTYLLDHSLVLQPDVPSLFQIIGSLKQKIDEYMSKRTDRVNLIKYAKQFMISRETRLVNVRRHAIEHSNSERNEFFQRNSLRTRSLNLSSLSGMFVRRSIQITDPGLPMLATSENSLQFISPKFSESQHVALCAVLLEEWVKELAAIAQEHTIAQLASSRK